MLLALALLACVARSPEIPSVIQETLLARPDITAAVWQFCDTERTWWDTRYGQGGYDDFLYNGCIESQSRAAHNVLRFASNLNIEPEIWQSCLESIWARDAEWRERGLSAGDGFKDTHVCIDREIAERYMEQRGMDRCERLEYLARRTETGRLYPSYARNEYETCRLRERIENLQNTN